MSYTNCISLNDALYFDLFDEIPYRQVKQFFEKDIDKDEYDFEVKIEDLPYDRPAYGKVKFTFTLMVDINVNGSLSIMRPKTFTKILEYNTSSAYALKLIDLQLDEEEDKTDEDETEEEEEDVEEVVVNKIEYEGTKYLMSLTTGVVYDLDIYMKEKEAVEVGIWIEKEKKIVFKEEKKEEIEEKIKQLDCNKIELDKRLTQYENCKIKKPTVEEVLRSIKNDKTDYSYLFQNINN